jgi:phosphatidylinositol alpha 1,6-mannosyltransferase
MSMSITDKYSAGAASATRSGGSQRKLRITIVAETFLPNINGVTNSVLRVIENMTQFGHEVTVIAPGPGVDVYNNSPVVRLSSFGLPGYAGIRLSRSAGELKQAIIASQPDVLHVAAPAILGRIALKLASELGIPAVAIYQTDIAGFASRYFLSALKKPLWSYVRSVHSRASLTLAPSTAATWDLRERGVRNVARWMRGVDLERFSPKHRNEDLRRDWAPNGEIIIGYVGRLAREKQVERLQELLEIPGVRVVVVGDGPLKKKLEKSMPSARFVGFQSGNALSQMYASFDLFVHTGVDETFCQSVQEALASGVPVIAPAAGGPLDLVLHGFNGYLWNPSSSVSLKGAVVELVRHQVKRERLASNTRSSIESRPWVSVMRELEGHYCSLIDGLEFAYMEMSV